MSKIDQLFRARPIEFAAVRVADAIQAAGKAWNDLPDWLIAFYDQGLVIFMPNCIELTTSAGPVTVWPGDWILCAAGEISVSKGEDAFARYYEPVVDATDRTIAGHCPMGCGETLFAGEGGHITCSYVPCPNPTAVDDLLKDRETEHIVEFGPTGFTVRHPLRERLNDDLMRCKLHEYCANLPGPPVMPGRYRAEDRQALWAWELLDLTPSIPEGQA